MKKPKLSVQINQSGNKKNAAVKASNGKTSIKSSVRIK